MSSLDRVTTVEGALDATGLKVSVVVARFNSFITERLLDAAVDTLVRSGTAREDIRVVRTPGSFEIPAVVNRLLQRGDQDAVIALGCLMRGDTIHFDLIAAEVTKGLATLARESGVPITFGVITTESLEQSIDRAGAKAGNKGAEAALAAIEQARLFQAIDGLAKPRARGNRKPRTRD